MARHVNSSFAGNLVSDVDPNALSRTRIFDEAAGNTALVHDLVTGQNSPPVTLDHSGPGNGCVLGLPMANQALYDYKMRVDEETTALTTSTDFSSIWSIAGYLSEGETSISMHVSLSRDTSRSEGSLRLQVLDSTMAEVGSSSYVGKDMPMTVTGLTGGTLYVFRLVASVLYWGNYIFVESVSLGFFRRRPNNLIARVPSDVEDLTELQTKTVSSATVIDHHDFDAAEVTTEAQAISGYHATKLAQNQHALEEMITGAPAGTNQTRVLSSSATQNAHYDNSPLGSEFSSMPTIASIPVVGFGFGAAPADGGAGEDGVGGFDLSRGCLGWAQAVSSTYREIADFGCWLPRHKANSLRLVMLIFLPSSGFAGYTKELRIRTFDRNDVLVATGTATSSTQLGSSNWRYFTITGVDHEAGSFNRIIIDLKITAGGVKTDGSSLRIAGAYLDLV